MSNLKMQAEEADELANDACVEPFCIATEAQSPADMLEWQKEFYSGNIIPNVSAKQSKSVIPFQHVLQRKLLDSKTLVRIKHGHCQKLFRLRFCSIFGC